MNFSKQRTTVLETLQQANNNPTAEELFLMVKQTLPKISLATVYRNLNQLADHGMIYKITLANEPDRFDATLEEHYHIRCGSCGRVEDVFSPIKQDFSKVVFEQTSFTLTGCDVLLQGICADCASNKQ